jgi:hypothetical protein
MASREEDKARAGLLRRSLARGVASGRDCPEQETLAAYYERSLDTAERARVEIHFSQCSRCREQLAAMVRAEAEPQPKPRGAWLLDWRLLAPVAAAVLLVIVWGAHRRTPVRTLARSPATPLVAMNKTEQALEATARRDALSATPLSHSAVENPPNGTSPLPDANMTALTSPAAPVLAGRNAVSLLENQRAQKGVALSGVSGGAAGEMLSKERGAAQTQGQQFPRALARVVAAPAAAPTPPPQASHAEVARATEFEAQGAQAREVSENKKMPAAQQGQVNAAHESVTVQSATAEAPEASSALTQQGAPASEGRHATDLVVLDVERPATIIKTPDPKVLWRMAGAGLIERSTDGGATWQRQLPSHNAQITAGAAPSRKICWLVGRDGTILLTKDGMRWKKVVPPAPLDFTAVTAQDGSSATVTAASGQKFSTENSGKTWKPIE